MSYASDLAHPKDRRTYQRMPTTLRGKVFPGAVDCVIRDMSRRGAKLGFTGQPPQGDQFVVVIWTTGAALEATRRWSTSNEIGVHIHNRVDLRGTVAPHLAEVKAQWANRRPKLSRVALKRCDAVMGKRGTPRVVQVS